MREQYTEPEVGLDGEECRQLTLWCGAGLRGLKYEFRAQGMLSIGREHWPQELLYPRLGQAAALVPEWEFLSRPSGVFGTSLACAEWGQCVRGQKGKKRKLQGGEVRLGDQCF